MSICYSMIFFLMCDTLWYVCGSKLRNHSTRSNLNKNPKNITYLYCYFRQQKSCNHSGVVDTDPRIHASD
jgi:hypothetical protein